MTDSIAIHYVEYVFKLIVSECCQIYAQLFFSLLG